MGCESCQEAELQVITCDTKLSINLPFAAVEGVAFSIYGVLQGMGFLCNYPVDNATVELHVDGERIQTAATDEVGQYSFMVALSQGLHYVQVKFPGEFAPVRYYNASNSTLKMINVKPAGAPQCTVDAECGPSHKCINQVCVPVPPKEPTKIPWAAIGLGAVVLGIGVVVFMSPKEVGVGVAEARRRAEEAAKAYREARK